jgi:hypothetical protein
LRRQLIAANVLQRSDVGTLGRISADAVATVTKGARAAVSTVFDAFFGSIS